MILDMPTEMPLVICFVCSLLLFFAIQRLMLGRRYLGDVVHCMWQVLPPAVVSAFGLWFLCSYDVGTP